ncbi:hypothetical protein LTR56_015764 [Elasticomyces elasticus]|nr:hypothetical protein LTR56_015764 [Elasticomyces elasticus]KAK3661975.1 hypothetical protein LTR22_007146 [Elasticomyces elasticus]KAK4933142.1 hypothetical protein LTR49_000626 [Elasticomyces elasticus]KAK5755885.1 hypothetical protein LTS12_014002 [Elasticomyces elasticus]
MVTANSNKPRLCREYKSRQGKGQGLQAWRALGPGQLIHSEVPLLVLPGIPTDVRSVDFLTSSLRGKHLQNGEKTLRALIDNNKISDQAIEKLQLLYGEDGPETDNESDSIHAALDDHVVHELMPKLSHNAFTHTEEVDGVEYGITRVFEVISRANYSCRPNAVVEWDPDLGQGTLYSLVNIAEGDDIEIDYLGNAKDTLQPREGRRKLLRDNYGFDCICPACGPLTVSTRKPSDDDSDRISAIDAYDNIDWRITSTLDIKQMTAADEAERRDQIGHLTTYIGLLEKLELFDGKTKDAYEARAQLHEQDYQIATTRVENPKKTKLKRLSTQDPPELQQDSFDNSATPRAMLRYPPTRIDLTSPDLTDFEQRYIARQQARKLHAHGTHIRLSPGPSRRTSLALVSEEENDGRKRAISSLSQATICSTENTSQPNTSNRDASSILTATTPSNVPSRAYDQSDLCIEAANALNSALQQQQSPSRSTALNSRPHEQQSSSQHTAVEQRAASISQNPPSQHEEQSAALHDPEPILPAFDGPVDIRPPATPSTHSESTTGIPTSQRRFILGSIGGSGTTPQRTVPSLLSSARARRRHGRSHDIAIPVDGEWLQRTIEQRHHHGVPDHFDPLVPQPVPELVLPPVDEYPQEHPILTMNVTLDPGAAVFVPRHRFGTATGSELRAVAGLEPRWSSLDSTHSTSSLRVRSSSEQNTDQPVRHRAAPEIPQRGVVHSRQHRRSRVSDQNEPAPNLDRYPLLRPVRPVTARRLSGSHRPVLMPGRQASRVSVTVPQRVPSATFATQVEPTVVDRNTLPPHSLEPHIDTSSSSRTILRPPSSEPRIGTRSSSLAWTRPAVSPAHRVPSMVSAASGISSALTSRHSSTEGLHAAAEFLRMRSSPLDDLTERLSQLAASRPRSVGHSWERSPGHRPRVSLLNGDPFRPESSPSPSSERSTLACMRAVVPEPQHAAALGVQPLNTTLSGLQSTASSPARTDSSSLPSTPPIRRIVNEALSPRSPLKDKSPSKACRTPGSAIARKPVPNNTVTATPRVRVYNDAEPAQTQPQTPADVLRSSRRARGLSDPAVAGPSSLAGAIAPSSPHPIPERRSHRHTYPSATPRQQTSHAANTPARMAATPPRGSALPTPAYRRAEARTQSSEENDVESQLAMLEGDRRIWQERHEAGTLDSTPPGEGRFERFL